MRLNTLLGWAVFSWPIVDVVGLMMILLGIIDYLYCANLFKVFGKGTPAPPEPPKELVVKGLYRYSRNPIYLGYFLVILGESLFFGQLLLFVYFLLSLVVINIYVICFEERALKKRFGEGYQEYCQKVPRWV